MKPFSKTELIITTIVLLVIALLSYPNLLAAQRRERDFQRKEDISNIAIDLDTFHEATGQFPRSTEDGKIVACRGENFDEKAAKTNLLGSLTPCRWGIDAFYDGSDDPSPYLTRVPVEPQNGNGRSYRYVSTGRRFQIYASLEGASEDEFNPAIQSLGISCGNSICNFGRSSTDTPLDKDLLEYENELREQELLKAHGKK